MRDSRNEPLSPKAGGGPGACGNPSFIARSLRNGADVRQQCCYR